jgi:hypothetical protein
MLDLLERPHVIGEVVTPVNTLAQKKLDEVPHLCSAIHAAGHTDLDPAPSKFALHLS